MKLTVTSISTCIWEAILSGARWQSLPDGDASWFPGSCQSKNREGLWTWTLVTGQWLTVNLLRWIRLSPDNHQTRETFLPSDRDQLRSLFSFLFHKHTTPATRRVGARVLLSDFSNVCNIPYNHTEMKPIELSSARQSFLPGNRDKLRSLLSFLFPTYFSVGRCGTRGLRPATCGVYVGGGVYPRPTYFSRGFPSDCNITRHDATRLHVLLLGFTNISIYQEYTLILE